MEKEATTSEICERKSVYAWMVENVTYEAGVDGAGMVQVR